MSFGFWVQATHQGAYESRCSWPDAYKAQEIAKKLGADIQLVYINVPGDDFRSTADIYAQINNYLNEAQVGKEVDIYNDYSVERGILNYCETNKADLIAIPTHGRKGLSHFFLGSIGEDVANHSKVPVITFKIG
jgi:nucleotide-binding universal stress UspA family protein